MLAYFALVLDTLLGDLFSSRTGDFSSSALVLCCKFCRDLAIAFILMFGARGLALMRPAFSPSTVITFLSVYRIP